MKAVIVTGGKQYTVSEGDVLFVEKLGVEAEETVKFEQVLAILDGENTKFGAPVVEGASVEAKVVKNGKGKKNAQTNDPVFRFHSAYLLGNRHIIQDKSSLSIAKL